MRTSSSWALALPLLLAITPGCGAGEDPGEIDTSTPTTAETPTGEASAGLSIGGSPWALPYRGGGGGIPFTLGCAWSELAVGVYGRSGAYVDQVGLICARLYGDGNLGVAVTRGRAGGNGGSPFYAMCPSGQALVGFEGRSGAYIDRMGIQCAPVASWSSCAAVPYTQYAGGGLGGSPFQDRCPQGAVITRIEGRSGAYVDAMQPTCAYLQP
jgi:hypothetical protein